jgi:hypothetical protein
VASDAPSTASRTIQFTIDDGDGGTPLQASIAMGVVAMNDPPVVTLPGGTATFVEDAAPVSLDPTAIVTDVDSADFLGGVLTVDFTANGTASDRLGIENQGTGAGQISVGAGTVAYGGTSLGTFSGGGSGSTPLVVSLSGSVATTPAAQALVRAIQFSNVSDTPSTLLRTIRFVLTDGDGGTSVAATVPATVTPTNDGPTVTNVRLISPTHANDLVFAYDISDPEGDSSSISVSYRGGGVGTTTTTGIAPGTGYTITWNSATDESGVAATNYELEITPNDGTAGTPGTTGPMRFDNSVFLPEASAVTLGGPQDLLLADLDRDGIEDLVVASSTLSQVQVHTGNGDGTFSSASTPSTTTAPRSVAVADLDRDGVLDVVVGADGGLDVLLGNGDGTLQAAVTHQAGTAIRSVVVADFDKDGIPDVGVALGTASVGILLGAGDGTLGGLTTTAINAASWALATGDLNRDGNADLVAAPFGQAVASVLLGNGSGGLAAATHTLPSSNGVGRMALADLDHDGALDMLITGSSGSELVYALGNGNGTFQTSTTKGTVGSASDLTVVDLDGDGALDVLTSSFPNSRVDLFFGNGDGTLQDLTHGDPDRDGIPDVLAAAQSGGRVSMLEGKTRGNGDGTIASASLVSMPAAGLLEVQTADFDRDGWLDFAVLVTDCCGGEVEVRTNNGNRTFSYSDDFGGMGDARAMDVGDMNSDGVPDIVVLDADTTNPDVNVFPGVGDGTFGAAVSTSLTASTDLHDIALGDMDRDGNLDVVVADLAADAVVILLGAGDGTLAGGTAYSAILSGQTDAAPQSILVADLDRDGILDVLVRNQQGSQGTVVLLGNGDGTLQAPQSSTSALGAEHINTADMNRDGILDLIATDYYGPRTSLGTGSGTFGSETQTLLTITNSADARDMNRDGIPDLVYGSGSFNGVAIAPGQGNGNFGTPSTFSTIYSLNDLDIADLDHDGAMDVVTCAGNSFAQVFWGNP